MPAVKIAFVFPGQGAQATGMGRELASQSAAAAAVFRAADEALGMDLSGLCWNGPDAELQRTEITQPAILTVSEACRAALLGQLPDLRPVYAAGLSLGEYPALIACGALAFADAVRLVRLRGRFMQEAVPEGVGAMAAILGLAEEAVRKVCAEASVKGVVAPANLNAP
ncbi:MAG: ACP S-malonyltransferase, partial [Chloroflexota bacterium]